MANPVLVELTRGQRVESSHRGAFAISNGSGEHVFHAGDIDKPIFPRSAIKAMQALLLVESGAADAYGLDDSELALAGASHASEPEHAALAKRMLQKAGFAESDMECGSHWPFQSKVLISQVNSGVEPSQLHNNCSGKHAGFLCAAKYLGIDHKDYSKYDHEIQKRIAAILTDLMGTSHGADNCGTDGCSIPTYAVPLKNIAHGFAKMASGEGLSQTRAAASKRLLSAAMREPFYVAGTHNACTKLMNMAPGPMTSRIYAKTGAEGVYCAAIPELGLGIAVKIDDGAARAAEIAVAALLARCLGENDQAFNSLMDYATREFKNWNGTVVGKFQPSDILVE